MPEVSSSTRKYSCKYEKPMNRILLNAYLDFDCTRKVSNSHYTIRINLHLGVLNILNHCFCADFFSLHIAAGGRFKRRGVEGLFDSVIELGTESLLIFEVADGPVGRIFFAARITELGNGVQGF